METFKIGDIVDVPAHKEDCGASFEAKNRKERKLAEREVRFARRISGISEDPNMTAAQKINEINRLIKMNTKGLVK